MRLSKTDKELISRFLARVEKLIELNKGSGAIKKLGEPEDE